MPITDTEMEQRHTGSAGAQTDPNACLGGAVSTTVFTNDSVQNAFDNVTGQESNDGDIEYRCFAFKNTDGSLTAENVRAYISGDTPNTTDEIDIGLGSSGVNGTEQTIANESTAPTSVTFSHPTTYASGLNPGNIPAGQHFYLWYRRTVTAPGAAHTNNTLNGKVDFDTAA